jgi:riboflavin synthase
MFTGIIQSAGKIDALEFGAIADGGAAKRESRGDKGARLRVRFASDLIAAAPLTTGASIAVNGCCLTVVECGADLFVADLSPETLARTSFGEKKSGDCVNLERPLRVGDELGGHMVQGHVDGVGRVQSISAIDNGGPAGCDNDGCDSNDWWLAVSIPPEIANYVVEKGSLTVDGISLTVASWADGVAGIAVIPFTYEHTNVRYLAAGDAVNLECDVLAKYAERFLAPRTSDASSHLTLDRFTNEGF